MSRYYIIAGEASGDLHGSNLMRGLLAEDPGAEFRFWGGDLMLQTFEEFHSAQALSGVSSGDHLPVQGAERREPVGTPDGQAPAHSAGLVRHYKDGAIMGFTGVLLHAGALARRLSFCKKDIEDWNPDVVILIDYPGFNFRVAEFAHKAGHKVFYYIAPKVWASREGRIRKLKAFVDKLFIVFPFEIPYFTSKGVDFIYKGNPLLDAVDRSGALGESREAFLKSTGLPDKPMIALLAGSRTGEIKSMMPTFMLFADRMKGMKEYSDHIFVVAAAPSRGEEDYAKFTSGRDYVKIVKGRTYSVLRHSRAAVVNSGTASLECALLGTPQVVAYKTAGINYAVAKSIIKVRFISLGNLILDRLCFRELLQQYFTPANLLHEVRRLIEDEAYRAEMLSGYSQIRSALGGSGASEAVAKAMIEELNK